ncbi:hypothetical protein LSM04_007929 [Trypanosoma melophagium]|uniref:uncharacterized protein n=1 Tax=Trypanosoma melophagium TaxID=715481 RepID=UPI00351A863C|nr:hypothetical protein LSM04_007929 [Trypanosoma melophagium]
MSEQQQQQQQQQCNTHNSVVATTKHEANVEDNFTAMRNAAMSMFKQRTKDLTMVSSLTAEADELEQLNNQVQSTINQLQEQKAMLEAQIETEESRVKEREIQLREVHTMLAQMKEDQGAFSGVYRSSEHVATLLQQFVTTYTTKGSDVVRLLEQAQERSQGRSPNDWRTAANDLRWRQSVAEDHIKQIERQHTVPVGFADILLEWSRGVWRQHSEYAPVLHLCEEVLLLMQDATETVRGLLPPPVSCELTPITEDTNGEEEEDNYMNSDMHMKDNGDAAVSAATQTCTYTDLSLRDLDCITDVGTLMEKEAEGVGLCCAVLPREGIELARSQCISLQELAFALQKATAVANEHAGNLEEQQALVKLLKERVSNLDRQRINIESNQQEEMVTIPQEVDMHENLYLSWHKALQTAATHIQHEISYQSIINTNECETVRLESELDAKVSHMQEQFSNLQIKLVELYTACFLEEEQKREALRELKEATDLQNEEDARFCVLRDQCGELETALQRSFEEMCQSRLCEETNIPDVLECSSEKEEKEKEEEEDPSKAAVVDEFLKKLLLCDWEKKETDKEEHRNTNTNNNNNNNKDNKDDAKNELLEATGLDVEILQRAAQCLTALQHETDQTLKTYQEWKQRTEEELLILTAE